MFNEYLVIKECNTAEAIAAFYKKYPDKMGLEKISNLLMDLEFKHLFIILRCEITIKKGKTILMRSIIRKPKVISKVYGNNPYNGEPTFSIHDEFENHLSESVVYFNLARIKDYRIKIEEIKNINEKRYSFEYSWHGVDYVIYIVVNKAIKGVNNTDTIGI